MCCVLHQQLPPPQYKLYASLPSPFITLTTHLFIHVHSFISFHSYGMSGALATHFTEPPPPTRFIIPKPAVLLPLFLPCRNPRGCFIFARNSCRDSDSADSASDSSPYLPSKHLHSANHSTTQPLTIPVPPQMIVRQLSPDNTSNQSLSLLHLHCIFVYGAIILLCHIRKVFSGSQSGINS